ncbi:MAG: glycosyltransferase [Methanolinea sp.]|jgi:glycosyltransferase involved in cell wall biosynthesis|nr:glycosyltransferase [Methanolinea sp.]
MRVAILTGYEFSVLGGAERLILDLARVLDAEVVVPHFNEAIVSHYDPGREIQIRSLGHPLPDEPTRQIAGMRLFRKATLDYDFYICIDDMAVRYLSNRVPHLYYMLTPRRAMYDMYYQFLEQKSPLSRILYTPALALARAADRRFVQRHVKNLACISHTVRTRIQKIYLRDARVLYPPVHTDRFTWRPSEGYWLSVGRVDKWKRVHLQVEAFSRMPEKTLVVVGQVYPGYEDLARNAPPNVIFRHVQGEEEMRNHFSRCEGFITTAIDEDFGITPVEAMASGKPVVAVREGGYQETVVDGVCGRLVAPDPDDIKRAVLETGRHSDAFREVCQRRAALFDFSTFADEARSMVWDYQE